IRVAKNGLQVLNSVAISPPDLILLDIHMPEMNGYETCKKLKENPELRDIPVIFISALTETFSKVTAFEAGGVDYITKPFHDEEVKARIQTHFLLRRRTLELEKALFEIKQVQTKLVLSEKMASLGVLSAGIAHEINNPINFVYAGINSLIKHFAALNHAINELIDTSRLPDESKVKSIDEILEESHLRKRLKVIPELAEDVKTGAIRTTEIVKGLRLFARSDGEKKVPARIEESVEAALLLLKNKYKNRIEIIRLFEEDLPLVKCHPGQLTQAFVNIIHNAVDAIEDRGTITIEITLTESQIRIIIRDTGIGMSSDIQTKIFDPFLTTKSVGSGMGLGLAITHGIIEKHRGTIFVESKENKGTSFTITLPVKG
ncbi:MAG: hybrid sensor histidine kinase/response regulator, partial [Bacteroidetes bacterium HGW-Bacteroidetes-22]